MHYVLVFLLSLNVLVIDSQLYAEDTSTSRELEIQLSSPHYVVRANTLQDIDYLKRLGPESAVISILLNHLGIEGTPKYTAKLLSFDESALTIHAIQRLVRWNEKLSNYLLDKISILSKVAPPHFPLAHLIAECHLHDDRFQALHQQRKTLFHQLLITEAYTAITRYHTDKTYTSGYTTEAIARFTDHLANYQQIPLSLWASLERSAFNLRQFILATGDAPEIQQLRAQTFATIHAINSLMNKSIYGVLLDKLSYAFSILLNLHLPKHEILQAERYALQETVLTLRNRGLNQPDVEVKIDELRTMLQANEDWMNKNLDNLLKLVKNAGFVPEAETELRYIKNFFAMIQHMDLIDKGVALNKLRKAAGDTRFTAILTVYGKQVPQNQLSNYFQIRSCQEIWGND